MNPLLSAHAEKVDSTMLHYYRRTLLSLFGKLHRLASSERTDLALYVEIQEVLIRRIAYIESRMLSCRQTIKESKFALAQRLPKEDAVAIKQGMAYATAKIEQYRQLLFVLRSVGDALIFLNLPRWDVKPMLRPESPGFLSGKKGLIAERAVMRAYAKTGAIAILNDLTNNMRRGDITVVVDGRYRIAEVKSGRFDKARVDRQLNEARGVWRYLATGDGESKDLPGWKLARVLHHAVQHDHIAQINQLITDAIHDCQAAAQIEDGLHYIVTGWQTEDVVALLSQSLHQMQHPFSFIVNGARFNNYGYYPFTLAIRSPDALYAFYAGDIVVSVIVDRAVIIERAARQGVDVRFVNDEDYPIELEVQNAGRSATSSHISVGRHFYGRLAYEFLSLSWFIDEIVYRAKQAVSFE
jgi:hypothetical protein